MDQVQVLGRTNLEGYVPGYIACQLVRNLINVSLILPRRGRRITRSGGVICLLKCSVTQILLINDTLEHV